MIYSEAPIPVVFNLIMSSLVIVSKFKKIRAKSRGKPFVSDGMLNEG